MSIFPYWANRKTKGFLADVVIYIWAQEGFDTQTVTWAKDAEEASTEALGRVEGLW